jgi:enoyl-[acyl-carrier-protein] reductase (NADH)
MSEMSVSVFGEEMQLEVAIDRVFKDIQNAINGSHCQIREMVSDMDRDDDYKVAVEHQTNIDTFVTELGDLFKQLKSVVKQITPKPETDEEKQWLATRKERIKTEQRIAKEQAKIKLQQERDEKKLQTLENIKE